MPGVLPLVAIGSQEPRTVPLMRAITAGSTPAVSSPAGAGAAGSVAGGQLQVVLPAPTPMPVVHGVELPAAAAAVPALAQDQIIMEGWLAVSFGFFTGGSKQRYVRLFSSGVLKCFEHQGSTFAKDSVLLRNARWRRSAAGITLDSVLDQCCEIRHREPKEAEAWAGCIEALCLQINSAGGYNGDSITMFGNGFW